MQPIDAPDLMALYAELFDCAAERSDDAGTAALNSPETCLCAPSELLLASPATLRDYIRPGSGFILGLAERLADGDAEIHDLYKRVLSVLKDLESRDISPEIQPARRVDFVYPVI